METIIGFAAGYLTGTQQGKDGLDRLRRSLREIAASPHARKMAGGALAVAGSLVRQGSARGAKASASAVTGYLVGRLSETAQARRTSRS